MQALRALHLHFLPPTFLAVNIIGWMRMAKSVSFFRSALQMNVVLEL